MPPGPRACDSQPTNLKTPVNAPLEKPSNWPPPFPPVQKSPKFSSTCHGVACEAGFAVNLFHQIPLSAIYVTSRRNHLLHIPLWLACIPANCLLYALHLLRYQPVMNKTVIQAELPPELTARARSYVEEGWAADFNELLAEALRRFLESHSAELSESFVVKDLQWGLHGND